MGLQGEDQASLTLVPPGHGPSGGSDDRPGLGQRNRLHDSLSGLGLHLAPLALFLQIDKPLSPEELDVESLEGDPVHRRPRSGERHLESVPALRQAKVHERRGRVQVGWQRRALVTASGGDHEREGEEGSEPDHQRM